MVDKINIDKDGKVSLNLNNKEVLSKLIEHSNKLKRYSSELLAKNKEDKGGEE